MEKQKTKVLFVGSFKKTRFTGGQHYASTTLVASKISEYIHWYFIDNKKEGTSAAARIIHAGKRVLTFIYCMFTKPGIRSVLLFTAHDFSFMEKGLMAIIGHWFGKKVILFPRSGIDNRSWAEPMIKKSIRASTKLLCQSHQWKNHYRQLTGLPDDRFEVIPNWIDVSQYPEPVAKTAATKLRLLYISGIEREKGIFELIEALSLEDQSLMDACVLDICGVGPQEAELKQFVTEKGLDPMVTFHGWADKDMKLRMFAASDVFLLPSYFEGMPNAVLESMLLGVPVIATNVGGIPDLITTGENGMLIEPKDPSAIYDAIRRLAEDPALRRWIGEKGRQTILERHNIENIWPRLLEILKP